MPRFFKTKECKTLDEFKKKLRDAVKSKDIDKFSSILHSDCPFASRQRYDGKTRTWCPNCPLSDKEGPDGLIDVTETCLVGSLGELYSDYYYGVNDENILARMVLESIKLLAYLDSKE